MNRSQYAGDVSGRELRIWYVVLDSVVLQLTSSVSIRLNKAVHPGPNHLPLLPISVQRPNQLAAFKKLQASLLTTYHLRTSITLPNYRLPNQPSA